MIDQRVTNADRVYARDGCMSEIAHYEQSSAYESMFEKSCEIDLIGREFDLPGVNLHNTINNNILSQEISNSLAATVAMNNSKAIN